MTPLSTSDIAIIEGAIHQIRVVTPHSEFVKEGATPEHLHVLLEGWAARYKGLDDGRRQISALILPGDICDLDGLYVRKFDYSVGALTHCRIASVPRSLLIDLSHRLPTIERVFTWLALVENAIMTEWVLSLGRRSSLERMAHLLCELYTRMSVIGQTQQDSMVIPLTQIQLSEVLGLTAVHVNRTLKDLRAAGLLTIQRSLVTLRDWPALSRLGRFDPNYLHMDGMRVEKA